ncbi:MAG: DUF6252 family protein [Bacteroidota bacterium]
MLVASKCKKDSVEDLPPETQTGANTFGCLVDGKVFIPKGDPFGGPVKKAQYQFLNGKQEFGISGSLKQDDVSGSLILIGGDSITLSVNTFDLTKPNTNGRYFGAYTTISLINPDDNYFTNEINRGQLVVKKFDMVNQIVSGTFWFDAKNANGKIVQVREGRFDMPFVR